ncbi:response regulator transcription factor [Roseobacter sp. HKCCA0434]|uniref:response regulator transcription factor n=1 Tax=Roseobacter sp. HKCCA0434 TaxID=3079297 RepID=UPI0029059204|nr:response regulator transcription factor [Roseobacter sp. HKCCA0434]
MTSTASTSSPTTPSGWALVIDDHPLFCDALELTLRTFENFTGVATAASLGAALDLLEDETPPALILLDLNLPDVSGLDGLIRLRRAAETVPIIIVSSMTEDKIVSGAITAGAAGFVPKHSPRSTFREALGLIARGEIYTPPGYVAEAVQEDAVQDVVERLAKLTRQQARILNLICQGKLNKQIAFELSIAEATVKAHVTAIMRKLDVHSRTQAALAVQQAQFSNVLNAASESP